jgi:hypothetical protein
LAPGNRGQSGQAIHSRERRISFPVGIRSHLSEECGQRLRFVFPQNFPHQWYPR